MTRFFEIEGHYINRALVTDFWGGETQTRVYFQGDRSLVFGMGIEDFKQRFFL